MRTTRLLVEKVNHEPALMDRLLCKIFKRLTFRFFARFLLKLGVFFVMVYTCFTITVGVFPSTSDDSISDLKIMEKDLPKEANIDHKVEERVAEDIPGELHIIAGVFNLLQVRHYREDFQRQCHQLKTFSRFTKRFPEFAQ